MFDVELLVTNSNNVYEVSVQVSERSDGNLDGKIERGDRSYGTTNRRTNTKFYFKIIKSKY